MEPGQLIFSLLSQAAPVVALVETRIFPLRAEQLVPRPYLTYQLISNVPNGSALCELDDEARVQVSVFADTYSELCALAQAVRRQLHRYQAPGVYIEFDNEIDHRDDNALCYFRSMDFFLEVQQQQPSVVLAGLDLALEFALS